MNKSEVESYLHAHIPLSAAMEVRVDELSEEVAVLSAPLKPNINHRESVFGGSLSALAIFNSVGVSALSVGNRGYLCTLGDPA